MFPQKGGAVTTVDPQKLVLENVTEKDEGWYTCIAANSLGSSHSTAYLQVVEGNASRSYCFI